MPKSVIRNINDVPNSIYKRGVLFTLNISFWTARKNVKPEDLGMSHEEIDKEIMTLGGRYLVNKKIRDKPRNCDAKARNLLKNFAQPFVIPGCYFIPYENLEEIVNKLEEIKNEFYKAANEVIDAYSDRNVIDKYDRLIKIAYTNAKARGHKTSFKKFSEEFKERVLVNFPDRTYVENSFNFSYVMFQIIPHDFNIDDGFNLIDAKTLNKIRSQQEKELNIRLSAFFNKIEESVKDDILEFCYIVEDKIKNKKIISLANIKKLSKLIEKIKSFNFTDNIEIEKQLINLESKLDKIHRKRLTDDDLVANLSESIKIIKEKVREMNDLNKKGLPKRKIKIK